MGLLDRFRREKRQTLEEALISAGILMTEVTKEQALAIPAVSACVSLICDTIASLPVVLYKEGETETEPVANDARIALLNDDTGDSLDGWQLKRALCEDYLLNGGGYAYIKRSLNDVKSLHFVPNESLSVMMNADVINKKYTIQVQGANYRDFEFLKLVRNSRNGVTGRGILAENNKMLSVAYNYLNYEDILLKTGANKKGFLKSQGRLSKEAMQELKMAWNNLYKSNSDENVIVLNNGLEFQEASQTSVELQMNEQKVTNSAEIGKMFLVPPNVLDGTASNEEYSNWIKTCISPILTAFETALNKDLLLPSEKNDYYFSFDTAELLKGDVVSRFTAYDIGIKSGLLQIDEARYKENLPPLGLKWLKLGLQDVLYFPDSEEIYTPNTNKLAKMGEDPVNMGQVDPNNQNNPNDPQQQQSAQNNTLIQKNNNNGT